MEQTPVSSRALLIMLSKAVSHLCFVLIAVVLARTLDPSDFGTFNQVWLVNKSLIFLFALGLPVSVYYFLPRLPESRTKGFVLQTMLGLATLSLPFSAAMYLLAGTLASYFNNPSLLVYLRLFAIFPLVTMPTICTDAILISLGRTRSAAQFEIITKVAMILSVAGAVALGGGLAAVFYTLIAYGATQSLAGVWMIWRPLRKMKFHFSPADWKAQLAFAAPFGFATLAGVLNYQADKVLIALFYPPAVFALYAAGAFEIPLAGVTSAAVLSVTMPEFSRRFSAGDVHSFLSLWHQSMLKLAVVTFAVAAFLMAFAEPVITILFGAQYTASAQPFRIYLLFLPLRITVMEQVLAALGETKFVLKSRLVSLVANVLLGYALVQSTGWLGPALSALLTTYLWAGLMLLAIRDRVRIGLRSLVPWQALGRVALVALVAAAASWPLAFLEVAAFWRIAAGFLLFSTIYLIANLKINSITPSDLQTLRGWVLMRPKSVSG